jgi:hypothetical protein
VIAIDKALRFDGIEDKPDVQPVDMTDKFALPPEQHHNWKYIAFGPDKKLYVPFGAPCNICEPAKEYAQIRRYNADGSGMEVLATGVRNTQGFDWHPKTGELWFTDHGRDWMGDNGPEDELNRLSKNGENFGYPYCHAKGVVDVDFKKKDACKGVTLPVATMGPHAAVMGVKFYTGDMFPEGVPEHDVHRPQGLVEPHRQVRFRRRQRAALGGRQERQGDAVHDRVPRGSEGSEVLGPARVHPSDEGRLAARDGRAAGRDLSDLVRRRQEEIVRLLRPGRWGFFLTALFCFPCACADRGTPEGLRRLPRGRRKLGDRRHAFACRAAEGVPGELSRSHARRIARDKGHAGSSQRG